MGSHITRDDVRRVLDAIRQIVQVLRLSAAQAERTLGLSAAQLFVLHKLGDGKALSVNGLAERTHTHQSSVSVVVQRLVDRRLVRRVPSETDGRRVELSITAAGLRKLRSAPQAAQDRLIAALDAMPEADQRRLAELLERLVVESGATATMPALFFEDGRTRRTRQRKTRRKGSNSRHG
jgi:DNA-binding MarR family transcriptional regulator